MKEHHLPELSFLALKELPEAVLWFDKDARIFDVNPIACERWGYSREEFLRLTIFDVNPNMSPEIWAAHWAAKQEDSSTFESTHRRKNGEIFPVDITDNFVTLNGEVYACAIVRE